MKIEGKEKSFPLFGPQLPPLQNGWNKAPPPKGIAGHVAMEVEMLFTIKWRATSITCSDTCVIARESCSQDEIKHLPDIDLYEKKTKFCLHIINHC